MDYYLIHIEIPMLLTSILTISLLLLTTLPSSLSKQPPFNFSDCSHTPYDCGGLHGIYYPFWSHDRPPHCGGGDQFYLTCEHGPGGVNYTSIQMGSQKFNVAEIHLENYTMTMKPLPLNYDVCSSPLFNVYLSPLFRYPDPNHVHNLTIFDDCRSGVPNDGVSSFTCPGPPGSPNPNGVYYVDVKDDNMLKEYRELQDCRRLIQLPTEDVVKPNYGVDDLNDALRGGFDVYYEVSSRDCVECLGPGRSEGGCEGIDITSCYDCSDSGSNFPQCSASHDKSDHRLKIILGIGVSAVGALAIGMVAFYFYHRRKKTHDAISYIQPRSMSSDASLKDIENGSIDYRVHLFTYSELEEATNYFDSSRELGDGGFGTVYFGKLRDGRCVAVKRLYENNYKRVEQFRNEIQILADLHHRNLVSLYGCTSRHSRELLLVYEYIPNGTVADHLHGERATDGTLPWHIRMNIAVETAGALAYLHASDVIHRDVKTNNILLDSHFVVKVADFGLSRLFPNNVTHISTVPQGTPGYVDPEYHECYQLTNKSDVYSFGVVLVELISSLPAVDITRHRHEINLSNMAINKIHNQALHELVDPNLGFESDYKVRKMINAVAELAFQCLQSSKDMRPSMQEVLDTLKDIQSDGKHKSQPEVMDISTADDVVLLKDDPPPPSPDSNAVSKSTTPNASG